MNDLTYQRNGHDIKTSRFLLNRKTCCKTSCLHCPYGFTLKKEGLQFEPLTDENFSEAKELMQTHTPKENDITASLMSGAFGKPKPKETLSIQNRDDYQLVKLKGETCALAKKNSLKITEIFHKTHFENQDITLDVVNSFL
jgi:hypothetical protein